MIYTGKTRLTDIIRTSRGPSTEPPLPWVIYLPMCIDCTTIERVARVFLFPSLTIESYRARGLIRRRERERKGKEMGGGVSLGATRRRRRRRRIVARVASSRAAANGVVILKYHDRISPRPKNMPRRIELNLREPFFPVSSPHPLSKGRNLNHARITG